MCLWLAFVDLSRWPLPMKSRANNFISRCAEVKIIICQAQLHNRVEWQFNCLFPIPLSVAAQRPAEGCPWLQRPPGQTQRLSTRCVTRGAFGAQAPSLALAGCVLSKYMLPTGWSIESSLHHWPTRHSRNNNTHTRLSMWAAAVDKIEAFLLSLLPAALAHRLRDPQMAPIISPSSFRLQSELKAASNLLRPGNFSMRFF